MRLLAAIPLLIVVAAIVFVLLRLAPGDPAALILGMDATPESIEQMRVKMGLNEPLHVQFFSFLAGILRGDLGDSWQTGRPISQEIGRTLPVTITLSVVAILISTVIGVLAGIVTAVRQYSLLDGIVRLIVLAGLSMPVFWFGLMLIVLFSGYLRILPSSGWGTLRHTILPALTLATYPLAMITRLTRSNVLEVIRQDYVRTAQSKGLSMRTVIYRHVLRNACIPIITVIGVQFGVLLAGAVLTETVFAIPGIGRLTVNAVFARDYAVIRAAVLLAAAIFVLINLLVDISYTLLDPRIRYG
jgi:ABC-type dipeptide/oligopeptide/nickel transport system permease component